jgi:hypothetical protein
MFSLSVIQSQNETFSLMRALDRKKVFRCPAYASMSYGQASRFRAFAAP